MLYCYNCGTKLSRKHLENEGLIPFCPTCNNYVFEIFSTAVSIVLEDINTHKICLIKQYNKPNFILVAGYVNKGENLIETLKRELFEELGIEALEYSFNYSKYYEKSNTLMANFIVKADLSNIKSNNEIDSYELFSYDDALNSIYKNSLAEFFLKLAVSKLKENKIVFEQFKEVQYER